MLVVCAFGCPFEDFAFDGAGVRSWAAGRVGAPEEFADGAVPECRGGVTIVRGENALCDSDLRVIRRAATKDIRSSVVAAGGGGVEHEGAVRVVATQVPPDLLEDQVGGFRAQHRPGPR